MYKIIVRGVPLGISKQKFSQNYVKYYKSIRHRSEKQNLCPPPVPKPGTSTGLLYTVGAVTLVAGGTVAYASYNPEFREWLGENVPYSDEFIKFVLQEDRSYFQSFIALLDAIKESFLRFIKNMFNSKQEKITHVPKEYIPPAPAFSSLAKEKDKEPMYSEIRVERMVPGSDEPSVCIDDQKPVSEELLETHPKSIAELESKMAQTACDTVLTFDNAVKSLKTYNADVQRIIEESIERLDESAWNALRDSTKEKHENIEKANKLMGETNELVKKLKELLKDPNVCAPDVVKEQAQFNIKKVLEDVEKAKKDLERERAKTSITDKYWKKVEEARNHFIEEIEILFPTVNIKDKKLELQGGELDLFILHAFANVLYYQKELYKMQLIEDQKIKMAMDAARKGNKDILTDTQIQHLVDNEKKNLETDFQRRCLRLRVESESQLRTQLKLQSETFKDHLEEAIKTREIELQRDFARQINEKVTEERCKFKMQLSALAGRVRGMDDALKARVETDKYSRQAQVLWSACQSLFRALKAGCPGLPWTEQLRPLEAEIIAVKKAAASGDELVNVVLAGIPKEATERGVFPEDALRERFINVEKSARQLALVPEGGARLPLHILSLFQSLLLLKSANPISQAELDDEQVNFSTLTTNDILQRARYFLDRGDFAQTLQYMNLLKGASRCVALQWMNEARILLETQQAANTLMAHAAANGLRFIS